MISSFGLWLALQFHEELWIGTILLLVVLHCALCDASTESDPSSVHIGDLSWGLTGQFCLLALSSLILFVLLTRTKLVLVLQILDQGCPIDTDSSWSTSKRLSHFCSRLSLDYLPRLALGHEIDGIELVSLLSGHLWVLNDCLLWTRLGLLHFFLPRLCLDGRVVDLRLLLISTVHSVEHLAHFIMAAEVLVQISVVNFWSVVRIDILGCCLHLHLSLHFLQL